MSKNINFRAWSKYAWEVVPKPIPASQAIPQWWRDETPYIKTEDNPDGKKHILRNRVNNTSFKKCTPMLDTLTTGYLIPLWSDVLVEQTMSGPLINWRVHRDVFGMHDSHAERVERPPGYNQLVFKYISSWIVTTPPGYSILVTSPYGFRKSTPFKVIDAIIDSDTSQHDLTIPCWLEDGFEGIVEKGTPMAQVIPFKRDDWKATFDYYEEDEHLAVFDRTIKSTIVNNYLKNIHSKKTFK